ncbi:MAG: lamin tail domain-containing protein, partial [Bacteroidales bacterium]
MSEVADPGDIYQARFVEIYNATNSSVDLSGWKIRRYANGNTSSSDVALSGTLNSGDTYVVAYAENYFNTAYGFNPDLSNGVISGNGDDTYELFDGSNVVDIYGEVGVDGTGEMWEYEDSRAIRKQSVCSGNTTWTSSEWTITSANVADMDPDNHTCDCPSTPTIALSTSSLTGFTYEEAAGPSAEQSFTVEGSNLTNNIGLTASTNYEISETSGSGFGSSITLTQSGGSVSTTTIYVRLKAGLSIGTYNNEDITASSSGATSQTVTCNGEVVCPSVSAPTATSASSVAGTSFTANWNAVSGATGYELDVYSISGEGPELVLNGGFETGDNSDWTTFETNYQVVTSDGSITPHAGSYMLKCFATDTRDLAQDITFTADGATQYEISFWYRYETASDPEKLRIWSDFSLGHSGDDIQPTTYLNATDVWTQVTYTVIPNSGTNTLNLELRSYTDGKIYIDDISFKATGGGTTYHLQNENVGNVTSYDVSGLTAGETYYYVVRAYNDCGNTSGNSNEITVITPCFAPTTEATNLVFSNVSTDQMDISWTNGDGDNRLVVASTSSITATPSDNTTYNADASFGNGDDIGTGEYVVYSGSGNNFTLTNLSS